MLTARVFLARPLMCGVCRTSLLERCMALMPDHPYTPSAAEVKAKLYAGRAWDEPAYVAEELRAAGFTGVETDVRTIVARVGTPAMYVFRLPELLCEAMS